MTKMGFAYLGASFQADTIVREYYYKGAAKKPKDSITRSLKTLSTKDGFYFSYATNSKAELYSIKNHLKKEGFFCNTEADSLNLIPLLYQKNDLTVSISSNPAVVLTPFTFVVQKAILPKPKEIIYAEDLTAFNSHEYLRYYFGDKNVKKDFYYLSEKEVVKCSVLFPNTNRQAVFLWADEVNDFSHRYIYIGGQLMTESSLKYEKNVAENIWQFKSGIYAGMSLYSLRQLNDAAFDFYGGRSPNTGLVVCDSTGKLDFKKENIVLGCMNCNDPVFFTLEKLNSDDALRKDRILFVHTIIINTAELK